MTEAPQREDDGHSRARPELVPMTMIVVDHVGGRPLYLDLGAGPGDGGRRYLLARLPLESLELVAEDLLPRLVAMTDLPVLDAVEQRVLGCLLEKQVTVPATYPLTLNALRTACNQTSNRDPVMQLDERSIETSA